MRGFFSRVAVGAVAISLIGAFSLTPAGAVGAPLWDIALAISSPTVHLNGTASAILNHTTGLTDNCFYCDFGFLTSVNGVSDQSFDPTTGTGQFALDLAEQNPPTSFGQVFVPGATGTLSASLQVACLVGSTPPPGVYLSLFSFDPVTQQIAYLESQPFNWAACPTTVSVAAWNSSTLPTFGYVGANFATSVQSGHYYGVYLTGAFGGVLPATSYSYGLTPPSTPLGVGVSASESTLTAHWTPVFGASSYTCTLMSGFGAPTGFHITTTASSCTFQGLNQPSQFGISVTANNAAGSSTLSPAVFVPYVPPHRTQIVCVRAGHVKRISGINPRCPAGYHVRH